VRSTERFNCRQKTYPQRDAAGVAYGYNPTVALTADGPAPVGNQSHNMDAQSRRAPLDAATKALIKVDYEESALTLAQMERKYGYSASFICKLAREGGWLMRSERMGWRSRTGSLASHRAREGIALRLARFINSKLDHLEIGMQNGTLSPDDVERGAKSVATVIGGLDKVIARPELLDEDKRTMAQHHNADDDEVERLQLEIIERFERIQRRRDAARGSE
jgi:hypothetical protein